MIRHYATSKPVDLLPSDRYACRRCGRERDCRPGRAKPVHCRDCLYVLRHEATDILRPDADEEAA